MKKFYRISAFIVTVSLIAGVFGGCATSSGTNENTASTTEDPEKALDTTIDYDNMSNIDEVDTDFEEGTGELYVQGQKAGTIDALCYYNIEDVSADQCEMLATKFGGTLVTRSLCTWADYFDKLATLVVADDSPDIVRYDWQAFPWGVSKNMYTALDGWLDAESPLWESEKNAIDEFSYAGKHYYFPSTVSTTATTYSIIYNRVLLDNVGLQDPMELYFNDNWNWDTFEDMLEVWANQGEDYIPFTSNIWGGLMFINTTGTTLIDLKDNDIINNMRNENVQRTMDWLTGLKKSGLIGDGYIDPGAAFLDGKLLFLGMGLEWGYESAQESLYRSGAPYDIAAVPFPRDPQADAYYITGDTVGYLVPAGASNIQGAVDWIICNRIYETDPVYVEATREEKMDTDIVYYAKCPDCKYNFVDNGNDDLTECPECGAARKQKYKPVYSADQLRVIDEMNGGEKIKLIFDNALGFSSEFNEIFTVGEDSVIDGPVYHGASYTQLREENYNTVESYLQPYRDALKAAAEKNAG